MIQAHGEFEHPIAYANRKLTKAETNYSTVEKECLALVGAIRIFQVYLEGQKFEVYTDHRPLLWMHRMKNHNQRLMRWLLAIDQFKFNIRHHPGKDNYVADALSRI